MRGTIADDLCDLSRLKLLRVNFERGNIFLDRNRKKENQQITSLCSMRIPRITCHTCFLFKYFVCAFKRSGTGGGGGNYKLLGRAQKPFIILFQLCPCVRDIFLKFGILCVKLRFLNCFLIVAIRILQQRIEHNQRKAMLGGGRKL